MRSLTKVISEVCLVENIPEGLKNSFIYVQKEKLPWCPPENERIWWAYCHSILIKYLPTNPAELNEWQKNFLKIWTGKDF